MARKSESDEFEGLVADRDVKTFINLTKDLDKNVITDFFGDENWRICTVVWSSGMLRYFEPRVASPNVQDADKPLSFFQTLMLILTMHQLSSDPGSIPYRVRNALLNCCGTVDELIERFRGNLIYMWGKVKDLFITIATFFYLADTDEDYNVKLKDEHEEPLNRDLELYADLLRRGCVTAVGTVWRSDEFWQISTAILGSGVMRYIKRRAAGDLDSYPPIMQIVQLLLVKKQADLDVHSFHSKVCTFAIDCCISLNEVLDRLRKFKDSVMETWERLWQVILAPL